MAVKSSGAQRGLWGSKLGFILAAAGSAVGLGNIWRFPYVTAENGGGAFVLIYVIFILLIGLPIMLVEFSIGRNTQSNPVGAFIKLASGPWKYLGYLFILTAIGILSYYSVVAGWTLGYIVKSLSGELDPAAFGAFVQNPLLQISYALVFILLTTIVIWGGVKNGIEKMNKILMPLLVLLIVGLVIRGFFQPGAMEGLKFFIVPDFSEVTPKTFVYAFGQMFFSLSLGMGAMITYSSYLDKKDNLVTSGISVAFFDTAIAILAGLLIFPVVGADIEQGGPTLVFVTLIKIFSEMAGGQLVAIVFFTLLMIASLTSTVSLQEVVTAYFVDEKGIGRGKAAAITAGAAILLGIPSALSLGAVPWLSEFLGKGFLGIMDYIFGNISLTFGGMMLCIFVAYKWKFENALKELESGSPHFKYYEKYWKIVVGYIAPPAIAFLLIFILIYGET